MFISDFHKQHMCDNLRAQHVHGVQMAEIGKSPKQISKKPLCFVIGPIGKDGSHERKHADLLLNALIKHVLEADEFGYKVKRADEDADPGMIGDRVVTDIIQSELVIADLTDLNPNAFYELGIRHSTELPTIHVAKLGTALPFDNVTHRTIFVDLTDWHSVEQARQRLAESTRAVKAPDYKVSNPITQANASFKMRQSEDPRDRVIAQLQERMGLLESRLPISSTKKNSVNTDDEDQLFFKLHDFANVLYRKKVSADQIIAETMKLADAEFETVTEVEIDNNNFSATINGIRYSGMLAN